MDFQLRGRKPKLELLELHRLLFEKYANTKKGVGVTRKLLTDIKIIFVFFRKWRDGWRIWVTPSLTVCDSSKCVYFVNIKLNAESPLDYLQYSQFTQNDTHSRFHFVKHTSVNNY